MKCVCDKSLLPQSRDSKNELNQSRGDFNAAKKTPTHSWEYGREMSVLVLLKNNLLFKSQISKTLFGIWKEQKMEQEQAFKLSYN